MKDERYFRELGARAQQESSPQPVHIADHVLRHIRTSEASQESIPASMLWTTIISSVAAVAAIVIAFNNWILWTDPLINSWLM